MKSLRITARLLLVIIMVSLLVNTVLPTRPTVVLAQETAPPTNSTTTNTTAPTNQTSGASSTSNEWWQMGPSLISFSEKIVGVCYPWLILEHFILNLPSGVIYPGTGGDTALSVYCGKKYFVVKGATGVYVFRKDTGNIYKTVYLSEHMLFISSKQDTISIYDAANNVVYIKNIEGNSDIAIPITHIPSAIDYDIIDNIPVVVYSTPANISNVTVYRYYIATPAGEKKLSYIGTGALYINGNTIYLEADGIKILKITNALTLQVVLEDYLPYPFKVTKIFGVRGSYLLVSSYGALISINIQRNSTYYKTFEVIGSAVPTPIGYYVPSAKTTYVILPSGIYPVPGYAVGLFSSLAVFTDIISGNETTPILWPIKTTVFIAKMRFDGELFAGQYAMKLKLDPGTYRLPMGAVLRYNSYTILLDKDEIEYPPEVVSSISVREIPSVNYTVTEFPKVFLPVDRFSDVEHVHVGGGRALLIEPDKAIVYNSYGVSAVIPGTWIYGGIGKCVVLYDGATFRLYDFAGNHLTNYEYYLSGAPDYITCDFVNGQYVVKMYQGTTEYIIKPSTVEVQHLEVKSYTDPTSGLTVQYTVPIRLIISGFTYSLPLDVASVRINKYTATWVKDNNLYILSIPDAAVYTLMSIPGNKTFFPLGDYVLMYDIYKKTVEVLAYKSWLVQKCYVDIETDKDADVYINNKYVGTGSLRVYTACNSYIEIMTRKPYYKPAEQSLFVSKPIKVSLHPQPIYAMVRLEVIAPKNLTISSVTMKLDNQIVIWKPGEEKQLLAKPYRVEIVQFSPVDACEHESMNVTFKEGRNTLRIFCKLTTSILGLYSRVPTTVKIYRYGANVKQAPPLHIVVLQANETKYIAIDPGSYVILSTPTVEGYTEKILNVTIGEKSVAYVDVTPSPLSKLIVNCNVKTASIVVTDMKGKEVASDVGKLEKSLLPGTYNIKVTAPGYSPYIDVVELPPGETVVINATLHPLPPPPPPPQPPFWQKTEFQVGAVALVAGFAIFMLWWRRRRKVLEAEVSE